MEYLSKTGLERVWTHITSKLGGKVDKEEGKGLSTNDYTTEEKEKLATEIALKSELPAITTEAHEYTDTAVANLVNSAPETLNTLGELAAALQENEEVVDVLNAAITTKYSADNPPPYPVTSIEGKTGAVVLNSETWTFTLSDGSTVTKTVVIK